MGVSHSQRALFKSLWVVDTQKGVPLFSYLGTGVSEAWGLASMRTVNAMNTPWPTLHQGLTGR